MVAIKRGCRNHRSPFFNQMVQTEDELLPRCSNNVPARGPHSAVSESPDLTPADCYRRRDSELMIRAGGAVV
jgi:hypothetical protein